jgi:predicted helicase
LALDKKRPDMIETMGIGFDDERGVDAGTEIIEKKAVQQFLALGNVEEWKNAIYAKIVEKCGEKIYWEQWAKDVAKLAEHHIETLTKLADDDSHKLDFAAFLAHLRINLNDSITESEAIEMLAQHMITKPVFTALFDSDDFSKLNPVSQALDKIVGLLNLFRNLSCLFCVDYSTDKFCA